MFFRADRKNKMAALTSDWLRHFRLLLWNCWTEFNETWQEARCPPRPLIGWDIFDFYSETTKWNSTKLDRKQDFNDLNTVFVRADRKTKMAARASDWLRHFQLLLWNSWAEFNKTWEEARSQRPLVFFGPICQIGCTLYSDARYVALWASCFLQGVKG